MDIALIFDYSRDRITGGPQGVAYDTMEGLKKNHRILEKEDININILSSTGTTFRSLFENDDTYSNISIEYFKKMVPSAFLSDINFLLHIKKRGKKIDLLHSHALSGALIGTVIKVPTVLTLHGMVWKEKYYAPNFYSRLTVEMNLLRFRYISSRLKKVFAISPYVTDEIETFLGRKYANSVLIENPVSDVFFTMQKKETENLLIYPGVITPRKNQICVIRALARLKKDNEKFHCVLPGSIGDINYFNDIKKLIKIHDLEKNVTVPGPLPFKKLSDLFSEASIMVMTSLQETAPLVISEAMASGTPVIAPDISGIPYMVSDGNSGFLIDPASPEDIADHISVLLNDCSLREKFKENSKQIAESRWKSEIIVKKQLDEYIKLRDMNST